MYKNVIQKEKEAYQFLKEQFGYKNIMQSPKIEKVIINCGVGSVTDKKKLQAIQEKLALITGQKPSLQKAKKSIAGFKVREGQLSGYKITLRGNKAKNFMDKLIHVVLPRTRDFRGLSKNSVDQMGNYTLGIKDNTIFPETSDQDIKEAFGLAITIVVTSKNQKETIEFLKFVGMPFKE
jgi:large subunit ribosomal protein L5